MKKTFFKAFLLLICALMIFALAACKAEEPQSFDTEKTATPAPIATATPEPEATPTPEPEATPTPEPAAFGLVPESEKVDLSYFDNVAFVGDSVSLKLSYYATASGALGNAEFYTAGSLGCANALWDVSDKSVHPSFQGTKMRVEDCIANSGTDTVYIMLGMNDIGLYGIDTTIENYETLVGLILEKSPDVKIVVQSMTPMTATSGIVGKGLNNDNIKIYNQRLLEMCEEHEWYFVDVASVMYDETGTVLPREFCSDPDDMGVHFTEKGCEKWVDYLLTHAIH